MKNIVFISVIIYLFGVSGFCFSQETKGEITFIRPNVYAGSLDKYDVYIDGKLVFNIQNKKYIKIEIEPGKHNFAIAGPLFGKGSMNEKAIDIEVNAGNHYNLVVMIGTGPLATQIPYFQEVLGESISILLQDLEKENVVF